MNASATVYDMSVLCCHDIKIQYYLIWYFKSSMKYQILYLEQTYPNSNIEWFPNQSWPLPHIVAQKIIVQLILRKLFLCWNCEHILNNMDLPLYIRKWSFFTQFCNSGSSVTFTKITGDIYHIDFHILAMSAAHPLHCLHLPQTGLVMM